MSQLISFWENDVGNKCCLSSPCLLGPSTGSVKTWVETQRFDKRFDKYSEYFFPVLMMHVKSEPSHLSWGNNALRSIEFWCGVHITSEEHQAFSKDVTPNTRSCVTGVTGFILKLSWPPPPPLFFSPPAVQWCVNWSRFCFAADVSCESCTTEVLPLTDVRRPCCYLMEKNRKHHKRSHLPIHVCCPSMKMSAGIWVTVGFKLLTQQEHSHKLRL